MDILELSRNAKGLEWYHTSADVSFVCHDKQMAQIIQDWAGGHDMYVPAMSIDDVGQKGFEKVFIELRLHRAEATAWAAYLAEMRTTVDEEKSQEAEESTELFDGIEEDRDLESQYHTGSKLGEEEGMTEELPLPGATSYKRARKAAWLRLPRAARAAIRRMHMHFGHVKNAPFLEILKATKCPPESWKQQNTSDARTVNMQRSCHSRLKRYRCQDLTSLTTQLAWM